MRPDFYPLRFAPIYKDYPWGGGRIPRFFGRKLREGTSAESWELSDRPEGMSVVSNGALAGHSLRELVTSLGARLVGAETPEGPFPILIKLIDAGQCLSVQVHPDDRAAALYGGQAKTEMWYVLDAAPQAKVYAGFTPGASRDAFLDAIAQGRVETILHSIPLRKGDAMYIPGGCVHAIDRGCLLLEIQQNSDTTYRVHDWGRVDPDGKPRPLHIAQALRVINWGDVQPSLMPPQRLTVHGASSVWRIVDSPCFHVTRIDLIDAMPVTNDGRTAHALFVAAGCVDVAAAAGTERLPAGTSCLLAAAIDRYTLTPTAGPAEVILSGRV